ncbi:MAG: aspartate--tRNA ligase [Spirochaetales bacterium]|nr:aspartate--tRNA ligase [Spirochaetales bacterium]
MKRTVTCGELTKEHIGRSVILNGWVHRNRNHGGIHFINLRDRYGITQVVIDEDASEELKELTKGLKFEYCIAVKGIVKERPESMVNPDMATGSIEIAAEEILILSRCEVLPFMVDEKSDAKEDLRLRYRYLDLRSFGMQRKIALRHEVAFATREYLISRGFYEIETPTLIKSTPEGARDFLVPSRINAGKVFALPQSPQLFKQILMVSGFDKYFQIARCYRDEDARGDRQLEFTQIDIEMSFVSAEDVYSLTEELMGYIFRKSLQFELPAKFQRLTYREAMNRYGSDKPDLRFDLEFKDFNEIAKKSDFGVFKGAVEQGGSVKTLVVPGCAGYSRKQISDLEETAKIYGAKGLAWMKVADGGLEGGISKFFHPLASEITDTLGAKPGDLLLFVADTWSTACTSLGAIRNRLGKDLELADPNRFEFLWIVDYPLFKWDNDEKKWAPAHHMFTMPQDRFIDSMEDNPGEVIGNLYDLVLNGNEIASGSIRCHDPEIQKRIFRIVGFSEEEAEKRFGFLLESFRYGPPPHGGIAPGLDRLVMIMTGESTIREVIPFPKNTMGISPMDNSPSNVDPLLIKDLGLSWLPKEKEQEK